MTVRQVQIAARARLGDAENAARDAERLLMHALQLSKTQLLAWPDRELSAEEEVRYLGYIDRRANHEPIQYITGRQEFFGLEFEVTPATLIPRPETELLVESVLARLPRDRPLRIADVGTGTGCIPIAIAAHLPLARFTALDISLETLACAHRNVITHGVRNRFKLLESDLLASVAGEIFDVIVSNPPYIPEGDRETLAAQVRDFEPESALFAGTDGLEIYRRLIPQAEASLVPGGLLALEIGYGQAKALRQMLARWIEVTVLDDLQGIPRTVLAIRGPVQAPA